MGLFQEMKSRGLVAQVTDDKVELLLNDSSVSAYIGFDPTADSLHVGHLVQIFNLRRLQQYGHRPLAVAGGATGLVGDPSGKSEERILLDEDSLANNLEKIRLQLSRFLDFDRGANSALVLNNADWLGKIDLISFLRDIGKHFSVNQMVSRDSVRSRLTEREQGISFTEFSYMLLQSYDFLHLFDMYGCTLQMGASDQWGNITAGIDLVRRIRQETVYGLTTPLVLKADGTKFGKSESGTIWLDAEKTSPFEFYQYFLRVEDEVVGSYLRSLTWIDDGELNELDHSTSTAPKLRNAQQVLAYEVTSLVHGSKMADKVRSASQALYSEEIINLPGDVLDLVVKDASSFDISRGNLESSIDLINILVESGLAKSRSESRKVISQGGVYVNNVRVTDEDKKLDLSCLLNGPVILLRRGKRDYVVIRVIG